MKYIIDMEKLDNCMLKDLLKVYFKDKQPVEKIASGTPFEIAENIVKWELQKPKYCEIQYKIYILKEATHEWLLKRVYRVVQG